MKTLLLLLLLSASARLIADEPPGRKLDLLAPGVELGGSLGDAGVREMLLGRAELKAILVPPHHLTVRWPRPVSMGACRVEWQGAGTHATHYGMECWDEAAGRYRLLYEVVGNREVARVHRFIRVRTSRIRFTIFEHPVGYHATVLRRFELYD